MKDYAHHTCEKYLKSIEIEIQYIQVYMYMVSQMYALPELQKQNIHDGALEEFVGNHGKQWTCNKHTKKQ